MADSTLEDRLRGHAEAFDGLLSLIPAKIYYGEDTSDQWKKKKQTKDQADAARRAKLDPDNMKSAKDVMDAKARKRKMDDMEEWDVDGVEKETPGQGLKAPPEKKPKKQKVSASDRKVDQASTGIGSARASESDKQRIRRERKQEKKKKSIDHGKAADKTSGEARHSKTERSADGEQTHERGFDVDVVRTGDIAPFDAEGLEQPHEPRDSSAPTSPFPPSPTFDNPADPSANTSTSSSVPPATKPKHIKLPTDPELLRSRLAARIEALRAARKADGPDGAPARNRQELMEARRKKEEQRRAHKKELRMKAKADEEARREAALASARDSPASSMLSPIIRSPDHNFSFGRVAFADGQQLADDLSSMIGAPKKKGPQDPATALLASQKKQQRLAAFDDEKQADIVEKDLWLNAKKRAHGERVHDNTSLLKKALKRKEKAKKKSEKEWGSRKEGIEKGQAMKQKKREENLRKRREEKGSKGKGKPAKSKKPKVKRRPGFEGSFGSGSKRQ